MRASCTAMIAVAILLIGFGSALAAPTHRVLVLDNVVATERNTSARLLVVEIETGKILAQADEVGIEPDVAVSPKGDLVAVEANDFVGGRYQKNCRLQVYAAGDLRRLHNGMLSVWRSGHLDWPPFPLIQFSPTGQEVVVQHMDSSLTDATPRKLPFDQAVLDCVKLTKDPEGLFQSSRRTVTVPRCRAAFFLRVADWPRVHIWNAHLGVVEVVDFDTGKILSRLHLDDLPVLAAADPAALEKPDIGGVLLLLQPIRAEVIPTGGRYAYYVPKQLPNQEPGFIKKIDLEADPPKIIRQGEERQPDLRPSTAAASEAGHALFVVKHKITGAAQVASREVKIFSTSDLKLQSEVELPIAGCDQLEASLDGKYMYALDREQGRLAVIEIATAKEFKVLEKFAKQPVLVFALPEETAGK
jgi:hypothetical protein